MPTTTIDGHHIQVDSEGFMTDPMEWSEDLAKALAAQIGIELTDEHWKAIKFVRQDFADQGETASCVGVATFRQLPQSDPHGHDCQQWIDQKDRPPRPMIRE